MNNLYKICLCGLFVLLFWAGFAPLGWSQTLQNSTTDPKILQTQMFVNIFTPNGDGVNDFFGPKTESQQFKSYKLTIFDRWGKTVFDSEINRPPWDGKTYGKDAPDGVYVYSFEGITPDERKVLLTGTLFLAR